MKLTVTYELHGRLQVPMDERLPVHQELLGPLRTGLDAANAQLEAENKKLRLRLVDIEVE